MEWCTKSSLNGRTASCSSKVQGGGALLGLGKGERKRYHRGNGGGEETAIKITIADGWGENDRRNTFEWFTEGGESNGGKINLLATLHSEQGCLQGQEGRGLKIGVNQ